MFRARDIYTNLRASLRWYSTRTSDSITLMKTKYPTDSWTNITPQFQPIIGSKLYNRANPYKKTTHPLTVTKQEITGYLNQWFKENVDNSTELKIYNNLDPVEPNTNSGTQLKNTFYVNQNYKLRSDLFDREMRYLKDGQQNFAIVTDLYRRCIMDATHFPVFHRINVIRTMQVNSITSDFNANKHFECEQKTLLETIVGKLFDDDVRFRWIEMNAAPFRPYWVLEIFHNEQWLKVSGAGVFQNETLQRHQVDGTIGWEIGIGLDRLVMAMFKIFDIRLLWNADTEYLNQFVPKAMIPEKNTSKTDKSDGKMNAKKKVDKNPVRIEPKSVVAKPLRSELHISYLLPQNMELEQFPTDQLCEMIKKSGNNLIENVIYFVIHIQLLMIWQI